MGGMLTVANARVRLPIVQRFIIQNMSLYRNMPVIEVEFGDGVFCLAGANGLGKSTFLATLNYALTGIVADPNRKFESLKEYYRESLRFSKDYFQGRVEEFDRDTAEVTVEFAIGNVQYTLSRGMFSPQTLRALAIAKDGAATFSAVTDDETEAKALHERYTASVVQETGLATFEQMVFLQHFLLTFDERRHLLFWDPDVARQALYIVFGVDGTLASQADEWLRRSDRLESQARNAQYQATTARQRIKEIKERAETVGGAEEHPLVDQYQDLMSECDRASANLKVKSRSVDDARHSYTLAAASLHAMVSDYDKLFESQLAPSTDPRNHPVVQALINAGDCSLCGSHGDSLHEHATASLSVGKCPLCLSPIVGREHHTAEGFDELEELDRKIALARETLKSAEETLGRRSKEEQEARAENERALSARVEFERANVDVSLPAQNPESNTLVAMISQLEKERSSATQRRDEFRRKRDEFRRRLEPVQRDLAVKYSNAEQEFIPKFQRLAYEFLGIDLQVAMEQKVRGPELALTINGTPRRMTTQLSESQRYFVDIALRMALAQHLSGDDGTACLLIDTPEGSLDIAYESRAGKMFGKFVRANNRLIVTANINSSRLVQELALMCGAEFMRVERMTAWTTLSEVQAESEDLFDDAFAEIEGALAHDGHSV